MQLKRGKILLTLALAAILVAGFFTYRHYSTKTAATHYQTKEEASDVYVRFAMEAYDKIQANYWVAKDQYNLPQIFELSLEKTFNKPNIASTSDRTSTAKAVASALKLATSTEAKKNAVLQTVAIALYNLEPIGRNGLMSDAQEKTLRDNVANVNPETHQVESTVFDHIFGKTLYLNVTKIAPTTLMEMAQAVDRASTTPLDSMIVDLRENVGGAMDFLPAYLGLYLGPDQYAFDLFSQKNKNVIRTTKPKFSEFDRFKELVFLSDGQTQSTSELTIDTFKRYRLAKSVGTKTKGWGTIENTYPIETQIDPKVKYTMLIVNSLTVRDDNLPIEGNGVLPDVDTSKSNWKTQLWKEFNSESLIQALLKVASSSPLR